MAESTANVRSGVTGAVYVAPVGTALPTDNTTPLSSEYVEVGFISDAGIVQSLGSATKDITAWQNAKLVRRLQSAFAPSFKFTCLETNDNSQSLYYGASNAAAGTVEVTAGLTEPQPFVFEVVDGTDVFRIVCPAAQATDFGDVSYVNGEAISYPLTVTAYSLTQASNFTIYGPAD